jgi:hypothetical protein
MNNNPVKLLASDPDYQKFNALQQLILFITNPSMYFSEEPIDLPKEEIGALKTILLNEMDELIKNYYQLPSFIANFINRLERVSN